MTGAGHRDKFFGYSGSMRPVSGMLCALVAVLSVGPRVEAQTPTPLPMSPVPVEVARTAPSDPPAFAPLSAIIDTVVRGFAVEVGETYELTPQQQRAVESKMLARWRTFFTEQRDDLEPLVREYLGARSAASPPSPDQVADWAARAMPVFRRLKRNAEAGQIEVRELLDDQQRAAFDQRQAQRQMGLRMFESQLKRWSVGSFRESEWWEPPQPSGANPAPGSAIEPRAGTNGLPAVPPEATGLPGLYGTVPPRIALEMLSWEKYVRDFCVRYDLDRSQRNAADSILREMIERALDHTYRNRMGITALEHKIQTGSGTADAAFEQQLRELFGPIDRMFAELDARIQKLPTPGQRRRAENGAPPPPAPGS
jgi:hypothetical protein